MPDLSDEDVLRLEIAMDQSARVRGHETAGHGARDAPHFFLGSGPPADRHSQGFAFEKL